MAFKLISRFDPAPMALPVADGEAIKYGQCLKIANGRLTAALPGDEVAGVAQHDVAPGTGNMCKVIFVDPEQIWEADYVGVPAAGFILGCSTANLNAAGSPAGALAGEYLDSASVTNGPCSIVKIDADRKKAFVKFKRRQLT